MYEWFHRKTRFDTDVQGNLTIAYSRPQPFYLTCTMFSINAHKNIFSLKWTEKQEYSAWQEKCTF